jgi:hypothetical protein
MPTRSILIALCAVATISLNGCAAYTVASVGTWAATGKSLSDHGISAVSKGDCNVTHTVSGQYYCEMPVVYNRSAF